MSKRKRVLFIVAMAAVMTILTVVSVSATGYDMTSDMTTGINAVSTQIMSIIGVVVPVVLGIVGAKLAIVKGISIFKSLTNKG